MSSFRASYFQHLIETDGCSSPWRTRSICSGFRSSTCQWSWSGLSATRSGWRTHTRLLGGQSLASELERSLDVIFRALPSAPDPDMPADADTPDPPRQRLHQALAALAHDPAATRRLAAHAPFCGVTRMIRGSSGRLSVSRRRSARPARGREPPVQ